MAYFVVKELTKYCIISNALLSLQTDTFCKVLLDYYNSPVGTLICITPLFGREFKYCICQAVISV